MAVMTPVRGVCPVVEVPFDDDGVVDLDGFGRVVEHVLGLGVESLLFPAFASEFYKLDDDERKLLIRTLLDGTSDRPDVTTVISVTKHATIGAVRAAEEAVAAGAGMLNVLPPFAVRSSTAGVLQHLSSVLAAVPDTPVILQHAPELTGVPLTGADISGLAEAHPNLVQVKVESVPPGRLIADLANQSTPLPSLVGYAGVHLVDAHRRGALGVQPGCSFVEIYQRIWSLLEVGDNSAAELLHGRLLPYISYWMSSMELMIAAEKSITRRRGLIRSEHCRLPSWQLDTHERDRIAAFLEEFEEQFAGGSAP